MLNASNETPMILPHVYIDEPKAGARTRPARISNPILVIPATKVATLTFENQEFNMFW
jgi:hypothetical protein